MQRSILAIAAAALLLGTASACHDLAPTESPVRAGSVRGTGDLAPFPVGVVHRTTGLEADVSWTFTAGPFGAVSTNAAVGLTVSIPAGALSSTETITVTALAGSPVAYRFEPHLTFARPVTLTQDLSGTDVGLLSVLVGAHFEGDQLDLQNGLALVTETVPALVSILQHSASFNVGHFSGWIVASGRDDGSDSSDTSSDGT